jgi:hypothetical protein
MVLTCFELVRAYLTDTTINMMKRATRVSRAADPGMFWFSAAAEVGFLLLGAYLATTTAIALGYFATFR